MKHKTQFDLLRKISFLFLVTCILVLFLYPRPARADALTALSDTMSRLADSTPSAVYSDHTIRYTTPSGVDAAETMTVTMPTGFTIGTVDFTDIDVSWGGTTGYDNELTLAATCTGTTWGATFAGQILTITSCTGTITATNKVVVEIGNNASGGNAQIQNHATAATYTISVGGTFGDTGKMAIVILSDDQVVVDTTIDPYLTFTISDNAVSLTKSGGLNPDYQNAGFNSDSAFSVNTNANSGYNVSYNGATLSANGGANTINAMAAKAASSIGAEQFGLNLRDNTTPNSGTDPSGGGSGTPAADYNTVDQFKYVAGTTTTLASASAATSSNTFTVTYIVNVTEITEAGAYSTTITYIATGNF